MPSPNSKSTKLRLATNQQGWREMDQVIEDCVAQICSSFNAETVRSFMFLIDIVSNADIDYLDRDSAALTIQKAAFAYHPQFETSIENYLNEINPGRVQK
jgi:succinate dehydrogenase flavin-adding protein (antitoxin of CptAB toxin-antitoxin module)